MPNWLNHVVNAQVSRKFASLRNRGALVTNIIMLNLISDRPLKGAPSPPCPIPHRNASRATHATYAKDLVVGLPLLPIPYLR